MYGLMALVAISVNTIFPELWELLTATYHPAAPDRVIFRGPVHSIADPSFKIICLSSTAASPVALLSWTTLEIIEDL